MALIPGVRIDFTGNPGLDPVPIPRVLVAEGIHLFHEFDEAQLLVGKSTVQNGLQTEQYALAVLFPTVDHGLESTILISVHGITVFEQRREIFDDLLPDGIGIRDTDFGGLVVH